MGTCAACDREDPRIDDALGACGPCLRRGDGAALAEVRRRRRALRQRQSLPPAPPRGGPARCGACANACAPSPDGLGFCGLRRSVDDRIVTDFGPPSTAKADLHSTYVHEACPASRLCVGDRRLSDEGFAESPMLFTVRYRGAVLDPAWASPWTTSTLDERTRTYPTAERLAGLVDERHDCVAFGGFGLAAQATHALETARALRGEARALPLRLCFESHGLLLPDDQAEAIALARASGGFFQLHVACLTPCLHEALTGIEADAALANLEDAATQSAAEGSKAALVVSTFVIPGYVEASEVATLAARLAALDRDLSLAILVWPPSGRLRGLPLCKPDDVEPCLAAARAAGLRRAWIGNEVYYEHRMDD